MDQLLPHLLVTSMVPSTASGCVSRHCLSSLSTLRSTASGCMSRSCSSLSEETSLSDVPWILAEEEGEEGFLDIFALERASPKTSLSDQPISMAFALERALPETSLSDGAI